MYLTKRQKLIYDLIVAHIRDKGYAPSIIEMGEHFNLSSPATIHRHLMNLEAKGLIRRRRNTSRSIELVNMEREVGYGAEAPLLGSIAAGQPLETYPVEETIAIPPDMMGRRRTYVLKVKGDSMIEDHIQDGDFVIVDEANQAQNGETVVALVNGESATLKRFFRENGHIRLQPANSAMAPIIVPEEQVTIQGVVIGLLRKF